MLTDNCLTLLSEIEISAMMQGRELTSTEKVVCHALNSLIDELIPDCDPVAARR